MFELKPISNDSVGGALSKAERYRLLNEPAEAESICRDVLDVDPENQQAIVVLVLSLSDQIHQDNQAFPNGVKLLAGLHEPYDRFYYGGILWERRAKAQHHQGREQHTVYEMMAQALRLFEEAGRLRSTGNDDSVLRWNTCVRFLRQHPNVTPRPEQASEPILSE